MKNVLTLILLGVIGSPYIPNPYLPDPQEEQRLNQVISGSEHEDAQRFQLYKDQQQERDDLTRDAQIQAQRREQQREEAVGD